MKYVIAVLLLCFSWSGHAQEIKGRVFELANNEKITLPGANVYWAGTTKGVVTDEDGNFKIDWHESGLLVASFMGCRPDTLQLTDKAKEVEFVLVSADEMLEEVQVTARRLTTVISTRGPKIEQLITGEELCKAACCNLGESFTTNASVDVAYADAVTGAKQIQLLGLTGKYVQMMTENMPIIWM